MLMNGKQNKRIDQLLRTLLTAEIDYFLKSKMKSLSRKQSKMELEVIDRHRRGLTISADDVQAGSF